jgi:hypothetical protein
MRIDEVVKIKKKQTKPQKPEQTDEGFWDSVGSAVSNAGEAAAKWAAGKVLSKLSTGGQ